MHGFVRFPSTCRHRALCKVSLKELNSTSSARSNREPNPSDPSPSVQGSELPLAFLELRQVLSRLAPFSPAAARGGKREPRPDAGSSSRRAGRGSPASRRAAAQFQRSRSKPAPSKRALKSSHRPASPPAGSGRLRPKSSARPWGNPDRGRGGGRDRRRPGPCRGGAGPGSVPPPALTPAR